MTRPEVIEELLRHSIVDPKSLQYNRWLESPFEDDKWILNFGREGTIEIDFDIELPDGSRLSDARNRKLLLSMKTFICLQRHPSTSPYQNGGRTAKNTLAMSIHVLDLLILHGTSIGLSTLKLELINRNDYKILLSKVASSPRVEEGIYEWTRKLTLFLRMNSSGMPEHELINTIEACPGIKDNLSPLNRFMPLTENELLRARAWLWQNGYYKFDNRHRGFAPSTNVLSEIIYKNTLRGMNYKRLPPELIIRSPNARRTNEFERAQTRQVTPRTGRMNFKHLSKYHSLATMLGHLALARLPSPPMETFDIVVSSLFEADELTSYGRYKTIPYSVQLNVLRKACEFVVNHGQDILDALTNVYTQAIDQPLPLSIFVANRGIDKFASSRLLALGVKTWTTRTNETGRKSPHASIRANTGLWDLSIVLYGAIQIITGSLMARRQDEMLRLLPSECGTRSIRFEIGKTGNGDQRQIETYPIVKFGATALGLLKDFHEKLVSAELISTDKNIFALPSSKGRNILKTVSAPNYNHALDQACDYFETPLNQHGQRYYIRQHQMRRFFAQVFFWNYSHAESETLTWLLGHADRRQFYQYITETTPGEVLRNIKTDCLTRELRMGSELTNSLSTYVQSKFGTSDVTVIPENELNEYLNLLQDDETITLTPHFFNIGALQNHRLILEIHKTPDAR
ncbi:hypothetical protein [Aquipseudomonas alcaligenes]|jgi:hypothetical protein|uniref:hypothetical protein n=1 Tax=Aquipseudomonas alcaligenes TaxID=43263 RepID=UPI00365ABC88